MPTVYTQEQIDEWAANADTGLDKQMLESLTEHVEKALGGNAFFVRRSN